MRPLFTCILALFVLSGSALAQQQGKGPKKLKRTDNPEATLEQAETRVKQARDKRAQDDDVSDDDSAYGGSNDGISSDDDDSSDDQSDYDSDDRSDYDSDDRSGDMGDRVDGQRGSARAQEMRNRRDERKQIKEEYRADREAGQERADPSETGGADGSKKAKKPWWKFWDE